MGWGGRERQERRKRRARRLPCSVPFSPDVLVKCRCKPSSNAMKNSCESCCAYPAKCEEHCRVEVARGECCRMVLTEKGYSTHLPNGIYQLVGCKRFRLARVHFTAETKIDKHMC